MAYRVKKEYIDWWYDGIADLNYIIECQESGIPAGDIEHMVREYGEDVLGQLEEV